MPFEALPAVGVFRVTFDPLEDPIPQLLLVGIPGPVVGETAAGVLQVDDRAEVGVIGGVGRTLGGFESGVHGGALWAVGG